jgi:hypothetical protein
MSLSPLTLYVLWHPSATDGAALASAAYRWFHASSDDLLRSGMGVPVFFRSAPAAEGSTAPRPIEVAQAALSVVVVLAEANMVSDPTWTAYLQALADQGPSVLVVPVALHPSAYRLPQNIRRLNFLRVDDRSDPPASPEDTLLRRTPRMLRQLTEIIGRRLAAELVAPAGTNRSGSAPPPLTIFISHAKRDGVDVAEALRSSIQDHGRLRAFFDDSDLPVGHSFASELERAARVGSAAMIAVVSDAYASRPWCRREIALARTPRRQADHPHCWSIQPMLVVDTLAAAVTRNIPELGNASSVRWRPENALSAVDLLMLEVLLSSYHLLHARGVAPRPGRQVISWPPDVPTLLALQREAGEAFDEVVYPGHALPLTELRALQQAFPSLRLRTFEEVANPVAPGLKSGLDGGLVGLSAGYHPDLGTLGLGRDHLDEVTLRITRGIVEAGGTVAFGGMLKSSGLTETLLTLVRTLTDDDEDDAAAPARAARIVSYQRWPALPTPEQVAADVGICEYVLVDSPVPPDERLTDDRRVQSPQRARQLALALSAMRHAMAVGGHRTSTGRVAAPLAARIVVGGLRGDFNGFLPGILEEALYALEAKTPLYIVGGFGGGAHLLARSLLEDTRPVEFDPAFHLARSESFRALGEGVRAHGGAEQLTALFERMNAALDRLRADPAAGLDNGLDDSQNRLLMSTESVTQIAVLLRLGLMRRFPSPRR